MSVCYRTFEHFECNSCDEKFIKALADDYGNEICVRCSSQDITWVDFDDLEERSLQKIADRQYESLVEK